MRELIEKRVCLCTWFEFEFEYIIAGANRVQGEGDCTWEIETTHREPSAGIPLFKLQGFRICQFSEK